MGAQAQTAAIKEGIAHVGTAKLLRVFWRSLFLQAAWNPRGMQNLGFAYALFPALEALYPDPENLARATDRHLGRCFNSHPYAAAAILGGAIHHEERVARGHEPAEQVDAFKASLMGPLAALGDGFFWLSLRPAVGALAVLLSLLAGLWGVAFFFAAYNAVHLAIRARFFVAGYRRGDGVVMVVAASRLPWFGDRLRMLAAAGAAGAAAVATLRFPPALAERGWTGLGIGWTLFAASYLLLGKGASPYAVTYAAAALALFCGLVF